MTPTERAIKNVTDLRAEALAVMQHWTDDPDVYREFMRYVKLCDKALARLRRGTKRGVTTA